MKKRPVVHWWMDEKDCGEPNQQRPPSLKDVAFVWLALILLMIWGAAQENRFNKIEEAVAFALNTQRKTVQKMQRLGASIDKAMPPLMGRKPISVASPQASLALRNGVRNNLPNTITGHRTDSSGADD